MNHKQIKERAHDPELTNIGKVDVCEVTMCADGSVFVVTEGFTILRLIANQIKISGYINQKL